MTETQQEQALTELLGEIARTDRRMALARPIEQRVMEAWDRAEQSPPSPREMPWVGGIGSSVRGDRHDRAISLWRVAAIGALAALVFMAIALTHGSSIAPGVSAPPQSPIGEPAKAAAPTAPLTSPAPTVAPRPTTIARRRPTARRPPVEARGEVASFVPLTSGAQQELSGSFQIARVRLPRAVLADLGVMLDANRVGEPIEADVVFGEDGLARAIRLAPVSTGMYPLKQ